MIPRFLWRLWDWLLGNTHTRCVGCGAMDEEMKEECVIYGAGHSDVTVDRFGELEDFNG